MFAPNVTLWLDGNAEIVKSRRTIGSRKTRESIFGLGRWLASSVLQIESDAGTPARERLRISHLQLLNAIDICCDGAAIDSRLERVAVNHANARFGRPKDRKTVERTVPSSDLQVGMGWLCGPEYLISGRVVGRDCTP